MNEFAIKDRVKLKNKKYCPKHLSIRNYGSGNDSPCYCNATIERIYQDGSVGITSNVNPYIGSAWRIVDTSQIIMLS
mgnify:CR=1 FL=1